MINFLFNISKLREIGENYSEYIQNLESNEVTLLIQQLGTYNKTLPEGDIRNYIDEIAIASVIITVVVFASGVGEVDFIRALIGGMILANEYSLRKGEL